MSNSVRLKDVAKKAGVGIGTASRVLNNHSQVSEKKRLAVLEAVEELGYRPHVIARSLKTNNTKTIGVIFMDITNSFFSDVLKGLEYCATNNDYTVLISNLDWKIENLAQTVQSLCDKKVDGLVYMGSSVNDSNVDLFLDSTIPSVLVSTFVDVKDRDKKSEIASVNIDNVKAAYDAVSYLIKIGHQDIGFISGLKGDINSTRPRMEGYINAMKENGLTVVEDWIFYGKYDFEHGYKSMKSLIERGNLPTAIFAGCDMIAMGASKAALEKGLSIPEDISVIGFDGVDEGKYFHPSISTIEQPRFNMGKTAMEMMLSFLRQENVEEKEILLEHKIVIRESCLQRESVR